LVAEQDRVGLLRRDNNDDQRIHEWPESGRRIRAMSPGLDDLRDSFGPYVASMNLKPHA
jgi:hypothetical protein